MAQTTAPYTKPRLSPEQVETYRTEGYLLFNQPVFPEVKFQALHDHFEEKLAAWPAGARPEAMDTPHFTDPKLFEWLFADEVLDLVESILGPDIALFSSHFICKPKGDGRRVPWHEDSAYWKRLLDPMEVCTVWLAIDPSTRANGCMQVIPRTHGHGYSDYDPVDTSKNVFPTEIRKDQRDDSKAVALELQPGEASLHDAKLMHGSDANTSDIRRCGYTMRYMPSSVKLSEDAREHFQVYLARGKDRANQPYGDPDKVNEKIIAGRKNRRRVH